MYSSIISMILCIKAKEFSYSMLHGHRHGTDMDIRYVHMYVDANIPTSLSTEM